jgi:hypothetical protein
MEVSVGDHCPACISTAAAAFGYKTNDCFN